MIQRVNGSLAVSRALGDFEYKNVPGLPSTQQLVSPEPDVYCLPRDKSRDEFILLACDGIYDVMDNDDVRDFVRQRLTVTRDLCLIINQLLDACLSKGSRDNMSAILIVMEDGAPQLDSAAAEAEQATLDLIQSRIKNIVSEHARKPLLLRGTIDLLTSSDDIETDRMMRLIGAGDLQGLPPGTGLHSYRGYVAQVMEQVKADSKLATSAPK